MTRVTWSKPDERLFETGLDRGVLYLNDGRTVPWNGLISVDENGGEGIETYYLEGRPYLYRNRPKEFSATVSAYTYPDEFSEILGVEEVSEGAYLDSQIGDTFSLCYRTLIGDAVNGTEAAYKLHVIYQASIVPSAVSYGSLTNAVNPVQFSWEIQAVPQPVVGYHSSAHVVLDSRKTDPVKLRDLEAFLYGNYDYPPQLPSVEQLLSAQPGPFDILDAGGPDTPAGIVIDGFDPYNNDTDIVDGGQYPDVWFGP